MIQRYQITFALIPQANETFLMRKCYSVHRPPSTLSTVAPLLIRRIAQSPSSCNSPNAVDLTIPKLDFDTFELNLQGSQEGPPDEPSLDEKQREFEKSKPWWSLERVPLLPYQKEPWCDTEEGLVPVCCFTRASRGGMAFRCIYCTSSFLQSFNLCYLPSNPNVSHPVEGFKCNYIRYKLCCEFLDFVSLPFIIILEFKNPLIPERTKKKEIIDWLS